MNTLNEQAVAALASLPLEDLSYCLELARRFDRLGIGVERASGALCRLIECGALPSAR